MKKDLLYKRMDRAINDFLSRFKRTDRSVAMTVNILIKEEEDLHIAHCLELDIVATAETVDQVQKDIIALVCTQIDYAFNNDNLENLFHPALPEVWEEFFSCKEQIEKKHRVESWFKKEESHRHFVPPWIITKTCLAPSTCHAYKEPLSSGNSLKNLNHMEL